MQVKFKKLSKDAVVPKIANIGDAGADLTATSIEHYDKYIEYGTSLAVSIPNGYVGLIFPRSSVTNKDVILKNAVGVIDSKFRGEIKFRFLPTKEFRSEVYVVGDRIGQLVIVPYLQAQYVEVDDLDSTQRGFGGYGSSGS